ncbi:MAG: S41 family peptidase, partial [Candidatus Aenigmarchaeota archaeon]|nr:S41 family peptidase [Candidatus Aenigmarchaeota archaeon]
MIILIIVGYNYDIYRSESPIEYVISVAESFDKSPKGIFNRAWRIIKNNYVDESCNNQNWNKWKARYKNNIKTYADSHLVIETILASLDDPYSKFLSKKEFEQQHRNIDAKLYGVGIFITEISGKVIIVSVIDDSPAQKYGLKKKDEIIKIDSISIKGLSFKKIVDYIKGKKDSMVVLTILRDGKTIVKRILRGEIKIQTVKHKLLDNNIAYIKISSFICFDTADEFKKALEAVSKAKGLIIDVRGNYGGLLSNAVYITNMFIKDGNIVSMVDRTGKQQDFLAMPNDFMTSKPVVILINEASASASEIFSGALKDHKRAVLVGEKTFGKGKIQMIFKLPDSSGINLTIAKYLTPAGKDIDHKGIKPDYTIEFDKNEL